MRELSPTAEAKDMKLAPTTWRARSFPVWLACWISKRPQGRWHDLAGMNSPVWLACLMRNF